eukprot:8300038-Prorocentrum_lima.AAC.1
MTTQCPPNPASSRSKEPNSLAGPGCAASPTHSPWCAHRCRINAGTGVAGRTCVVTGMLRLRTVTLRSSPFAIC